MTCNFLPSLLSQQRGSEVVNSVEGLIKKLIQEGGYFKQSEDSLINWCQTIRTDSFKSVPLELESLYCGFFSNSVGQAFAAAYEVALQRLTGADTIKSVASFCVTENKSTHPASMRSSLSIDDGGRYQVSGKKDFVTLAREAKKLFVAVRFGASGAGQSKIKLVEIAIDAPGVNVQLLPDLPFVSDVSHGVVSFDSVVVDQTNIFSGDGYANYVKPFRWLEDINVFMSVAAYLFKLSLAFKWPVEARVEMISLLVSLSNLQKMKADSPVSHVVMFELADNLDQWLTRYNEAWSGVPEMFAIGWKRDLALLKVAARARKARYKNAMAVLDLP